MEDELLSPEEQNETPAPEAAAPSLGMTKAELDARMAEMQGPPAPPKKLTKVAILGFTDTWKQAPFDDPEWEIWGLNELYLFVPRWTRWFEIHSRAVYEADKKRTDEHIPRLRAMTCPIYMHQHWDDIPSSVPYPFAQICEMFANPAKGAKPYLTNTISYMLALAIMEGFEEIGVYGVDMCHDTEYSHQKPSCEYFVGMAQGRGIKVTIPPESDLVKTLFFYGYEEAEALAFDQKMKARAADLEVKFNQLTAQLQQIDQQRQQYIGAAQDAKHILTNWKSLHS